MAKPPSLCNRYTLRLYIRDDTEADIADYLAPLDRFFRQERLRELLRLGWLAEQQGGIAPLSPNRPLRPVTPTEPGTGVQPLTPAPVPAVATAEPAPVLTTEPLTDLVDGPHIVTEPAFALPEEDIDLLDPLAVMQRRSNT